MSVGPFNLLPDDQQVTADDDLAAAVTGALALPDEVQPAAEDPPEPIGRTWQFDFEQGQFVWAGASPARTSSDASTLAQWCLMAIHSERFGNAVFSDEFGMEQPDDLIGTLASGEAIADWQRHLVDALLVHDRIVDVRDIVLSYDPTVGVLTIQTFDVVTDEDQTLSLGPTALQIGGTS